MKFDTLSRSESVTPLFLIGIARSGTTLVQALLDGHPQLLVDVADSHFYRWYKRYYRWLNVLSSWKDTPEQRLQWAEDFMISYIFNEGSRYYQDFLHHISIQELKDTFRHLARGSAQEPKDYLESYFLALGLTSHTLTERTRYWVSKNLSYEYLLYRYNQWWPEAKFIFIIRDPRDVYSSYKRRDIKDDREVTSVDKFAYVWAESSRTLLEFQTFLNEENLFVLKYEELVIQQEVMMRQLADFLNIKYTPGLLSPTKGFGKVPWGGNPESGRKNHRIYRNAMNKWQALLSPQEINSLESLLAEEMVYTGYKLSTTPRSNPPLQLKLHIRTSLFKVLNYRL